MLVGITVLVFILGYIFSVISSFYTANESVIDTLIFFAVVGGIYYVYTKKKNKKIIETQDKVAVITESENN